MQAAIAVTLRGSAVGHAVHAFELFLPIQEYGIGMHSMPYDTEKPPDGIRRSRFVKPPAKTKRISRRGAELAEKDKGTRFDLRLLPFVALQTFEILSACEDFIERSGFRPSPVLAFSACSAPLREVLPSPLSAVGHAVHAIELFLPIQEYGIGMHSMPYDTEKPPDGTRRAPFRHTACKNEENLSQRRRARRERQGDKVRPSTFTFRCSANV